MGRTFVITAVLLSACGGQVGAPSGDTLGPGDTSNESDVSTDDTPDGGELAVTLAPEGVLVAVVGEELAAAAESDGVAPFVYIWTSSRDGVVGHDATFATHDLTEGDHNLELRVTDAEGATGTVSRSVHVLPRQFDWSHKLLPNAPPAAGDWMSPVKNQETCGSCWSHAALGAMEARWNIQNGDPTLDIDLSEQWLIDCHTNGAVGCGGGAPEQALDFVAASGVPTEDCDPFVSRNDVCNSECNDGSQPSLWRIGERHNVFGNKAVVQSSTRDTLVHEGPVPRSMGGIYDWNPSTFECDTLQYSHYVVIVGYDHDAGVWLAKNSWGASWNGNGYLKIKYGTCGMDAATTSYGAVTAP